MKNIFLSILFFFCFNYFKAQEKVENSLFIKTRTGKVYGKLIIPIENTPVPIVLLISDGGYTDGDGNSPTIKTNCLKKLADQLLQNNIASLRFDKRGVGDSKDSEVKEKEMRFEYYIEDVIDWISLLKKDKRFSQFIIIGHGEGSLIGMVAAQRFSIYSFISIAGSGLSGDEQMKEKVNKYTESGKKICYEVIDSLKNNKTIPITDPTLNSMFRENVQPYLISWFQFNPQKEINKLTIPILILQGTEDNQTGPDDAILLHRSNNKSEYITIRNMNHYLKNGREDNPQTLVSRRDPTIPILPELVKSIVDFIQNK